MFLSADFRDLGAAFNVRTNAFAKEYLYKKCAFIGNKTISVAYTIFILTIWHGFHAGYIITFFFEFFSLQMEELMRSGAPKSPILRWISTGSGRFLRHIYYQFSITMIHISFALLSFSHFKYAMRELHGIPLTVIAAWNFIIIIGRVRT
jgi:hypothetical protein